MHLILMHSFKPPNEPRKQIKKKKIILEISVWWVFTHPGVKYPALTVQDQETPN